MRTLKLLCAAAIMLVIVSCGSKSGSSSDKPAFDNAVDYNNYVIGQQEKIVTKMNEMSQAIEAETYDLAETKRLELVKQCGTSIDSVKLMDAYNNNTAFRDEAVKLFTFYKEISEKEYKEMLDLLKKEDFGEADLDRMNQIKEDITKRENERDGAFAGAQSTFYKENNIGN